MPSSKALRTFVSSAAADECADAVDLGIERDLLLTGPGADDVLPLPTPIEQLN